MRVLILTPSAFPDISGNAASVARWQTALVEKGIVVKVLAGKTLDAGSFAEQARQFRPDVIHVHHAFRCGTLLEGSRPALEKMRAAIVASPGGTDINEDLLNPAKKRLVQQVFEMAGAIIVQSPQIREHFTRHFPALSNKIVFVPKAVFWFGERAYDLRNAAGCSSEHILFLHPSGIRPVKGNLECLKGMARVYALRPQVRLVVAGPVVDEEYAFRFEREIAAHAAFACWIQGIPPAAMRSAFQAADIVLNTSFSEGLSNSLIEAVAAGKPVLASDIQGNRWPVLGENKHAPAGLLYDLHDPEDFIAKAVSLIDDAPLRASLSRAARSAQAQRPSAGDEADGLLAAYAAAIGEG